MCRFTGLCAIGIVATSPLLRRLYMERFWIHGRGTVIRLEGVSQPTHGVPDMSLRCGEPPVCARGYCPNMRVSRSPQKKAVRLTDVLNLNHSGLMLMSRMIRP